MQTTCNLNLDLLLPWENIPKFGARMVIINCTRHMHTVSFEPHKNIDYKTSPDSTSEKTGTQRNETIAKDTCPNTTSKPNSSCDTGLDLPSSK